MKYYSTNGNAPLASLADAVRNGLAPDGGLYLPVHLGRMPRAFFDNISEMTFREMSFAVAYMLFGEDVPPDDLKSILADTLNFEVPLVKVDDRIFSLELFHGPTLAFKDFGARFLARLMSYFHTATYGTSVLNVLVATSGDSGGAVANGFYGVPGVRVLVLYPSGKLSALQEAQFATLGENIMALEIDGNFDDCQALVKQALMDDSLKGNVMLTSANSINVGRLLPQMFYYFSAYSQLLHSGATDSRMVVAVPSGNLGNLTAGVFAKMAGLPVSRFYAANNSNDVMCRYLATGSFEPKPVVDTIASAMDVGNPSNFSRILALYDNDYSRICADMCGATYSDDLIADTILNVYHHNHYLLDPHGATAYRALADNLRPGEVGVMLETAHPSKFKVAVERVIGEEIDVPSRLSVFLGGEKRSIGMPSSYGLFKRFLLSL